MPKQQKNKSKTNTRKSARKADTGLRDAVGDEFAKNVPARQLFAANLVFPTRKIVQMVYGSTFSLTTGSTDLFGAERAFRMNSIFQPDASGGHQPYAYDVFSAIYALYLVRSCRVQITIFDPSADGVVLGILYRNNFNNTNTLAGNSINAIMEQPAAIVRHVMNTGSQARQVDTMVPCHLAMGMSKKDYDGNWSQTGAIYNANPVLSPYLTIAASDSDAATAKTVKVSLRLTYTVELRNNLSLPQS